MNEYKKINNEPIAIEYVEDEHEQGNDYKPSFWFYNRRYFLEDFTRTHNNPFVFDNFPEYIHAYETDNYFNTLYIELISDEAVNIYK